MDKECVTVEYLKEIVCNLFDAGYGDMKVELQDAFLHTDEISCNFVERKLEIKGYLFNSSVAQNYTKFCQAIDKAREEFLINNY